MKRAFTHFKNSDFVNACLLIILLGLYSVSYPAYSSAETSVSADIVILYDQSFSVNTSYRQSKNIDWLTGLISDLPTADRLVLAGFDEKVHKPNIFSHLAKQNLTAALTIIKKSPLKGVVTDLEAPLAFLLSYENKIATAIIISDWVPDIWDKRSKTLSPSIIKDPRYQKINSRYNDLLLQGMTADKIYNELYSDYFKKNISLIEQSLESLKNKFGNDLIFIDIGGRSDFITKWANICSAEVKIRPEKELNKDIKTSSIIIFPTTGDEKMAEVKISTAEKKDLIDNSIQSNSLLVNSSSAKESFIPQVQTTEKNTNSQILYEKSIEYRADPISIIIAVFLSISVLGFFWLKREKFLKDRAQEQQEIVERERKEMLRLTQDKVRLIDDISQISSRIEEKNTRMNMLLKQESDLALEIDRRKDGMSVELEEYRLDQLSIIDKEVRNEKSKRFDNLNDEFEIKRKEMQNELLDKKNENFDELKRLKDSELLRIEKEIEKENEVKKQASLKEIEKWAQAERDEKMAAIKLEIEEAEQTSKQEIERWEKEAQQRVVELLDTDYREKVENYRTELQSLADQKDELTHTTASLKTNHEQLKNELAEMQAMVKHGLEAAAKKSMEEIKEREEKLWNETVEQTNLERAKAFDRIKKWEEQEKERLFNSFQAKIE